MPVLGICYGMQLMTHALGGEVAPAPHREFGLATIQFAHHPEGLVESGKRRAHAFIERMAGRRRREDDDGPDQEAVVRDPTTRRRVEEVVS